MTTWKIGDRVVIDASHRQKFDGKRGTIVASENVGPRLPTPVISLDDNTILYGCECWWSFDEPGTHDAATGGEG